MNALLPSLKTKGIHTDNTDVMPVFRDFAQRKIDILVVAAKNADMEIPKASLVVQFDLLDRHVDYAFSKAHSSNRLILLAERGKPMHRRITEGLTQSNADLDRWMMTLFANRTLAPQGPLGLPSATQYVPDHDDDDNEKDIVLVNATTGGRLNAHEAVSAIYTYAATLGVAPNVAILELLPLLSSLAPWHLRAGKLAAPPASRHAKSSVSTAQLTVATFGTAAYQARARSRTASPLAVHPAARTLGACPHSGASAPVHRLRKVSIPSWSNALSVAVQSDIVLLSF
ncbi:hypothetical protein HDZ31DRAFT_70140 [Schizophyllum fasciatum]